MIHINYVVVFSSIIVYVTVANYTETSSTSDSVIEGVNRSSVGHNLTNNIYIPNNGNKLIKSFLVVTDDNDTIVLRTRDKRKKKPRPTDRNRLMPTCLYYFEMEEDGHKINEFFMYNLRDVRTFFQEILRTDICYNSCVNLPSPKPRE